MPKASTLIAVMLIFAAASWAEILAERQARPGEFRGFGEDEEAAAADALVRLASSYAAYFEEALAALK
jgi:hypothetical protein